MFYSLKMSSISIDIMTVLYFRAFLTPLVHLIELIIGHCLKNLPDEEFLCWLLDYYEFGTTNKGFV